MNYVRPAFCLLVILCSRTWSVGMEPDVQRTIPAGTAVLIEFPRPESLLQNPFARDALRILKESVGVRRGLESAEFGRLRDAARFLENSLGVDYQTAVSRLTAGGVVIAVEPERPGEPPDVTVVVTAEDEASLQRLLEAVHAELGRRAAERVPADRPQVARRIELASHTYRSFVCYSFGNGHYAVAGRRLLAANRQQTLEAALDRLSDPSIGDQFHPPQSLRFPEESVQPPWLLVTLNLHLLRQNPECRLGLQLPAGEIAPLALFGGYLDLLQRADFAAAGLFGDDTGIEFKVRLPSGTEGTPAGMSGFFTGDATTSAASLLRPARTLYTGSWYRDYARFWNSRAELFTPAVQRELQDADDRQRKQWGGLAVSDLLQLMGPHHRIVVARQQEHAYLTQPEERLPAAGVVVDLPNVEKFRERILTPVDRLLRTAVLAIGGEFKTVSYRGNLLAAIRFAEPEPVTDPKKQAIYNFNPAYCISRGHLIAGSTAEIVREIIEELDHEAARLEPGITQSTRLAHQEELSMSELAELLGSYERSIVARLVADRGLSDGEAGTELQIFRRLLTRLGKLSSQILVGPQQFDLTVRLGGSRPAAEGASTTR